MEAYSHQTRILHVNLLIVERLAYRHTDILRISNLYGLSQKVQSSFEPRILEIKQITERSITSLIDIFCNSCYIKKKDFFKSIVKTGALQSYFNRKFFEKKKTDKNTPDLVRLIAFAAVEFLFSAKLHRKCIHLAIARLPWFLNSRTSRGANATKIYPALTVITGRFFSAVRQGLASALRAPPSLSSRARVKRWKKVSDSVTQNYGPV